MELIRFLDDVIGIGFIGLIIVVIIFITLIISSGIESKREVNNES